MLLILMSKLFILIILLFTSSQIIQNLLELISYFAFVAQLADLPAYAKA